MSGLGIPPRPERWRLRFGVPPGAARARAEGLSGGDRGWRLADERWLTVDALRGDRVRVWFAAVDGRLLGDGRGVAGPDFRHPQLDAAWAAGEGDVGELFDPFEETADDPLDAFRREPDDEAFDDVDDAAPLEDDLPFDAPSGGDDDGEWGDAE